MNKFNAMAILIILLIGSNALSFYFYDQWQGAKSAVSDLEKEIDKKEKKIVALNANQDYELLTFGEEFVTILFTYDSKQTESSSERALERAVGAARDKLKGDASEEEYGEMNGVEDITSTVSILDSNYNKLAADKAAVTIQFEQLVTMDTTHAKILNEMKLQMIFTEDGWKVEDYEIEQLL